MPHQGIVTFGLDPLRFAQRDRSQYVEAGGFTDKTSCPADRIAETARARAWMALAVSKTGDKGLAVW
jgi:hypothetical protein